VVSCPDAFPRTFTPKELVRRSRAAGGPRPDEELSDFLSRLHVGRTAQELLRNDPLDDVADPIGGPRSGYVRTATELDQLVSVLAPLLSSTRLSPPASGDAAPAAPTTPVPSLSPQET
jgi:hypothetical protein